MNQSRAVLVGIAVVGGYLWLRSRRTAGTVPDVVPLASGDLSPGFGTGSGLPSWRGLPSAWDRTDAGGGGSNEAETPDEADVGGGGGSGFFVGVGTDAASDTTDVPSGSHTLSPSSSSGPTPTAHQLARSTSAFPSTTTGGHGTIRF